MFYLKVILWILSSVSYSSCSRTNELPSWITNNPAFNNSTKIDSIRSGCGSINNSQAEDLSWLIFLNDEPGYGVEIKIEKLSLDEKADNYLLVAGWPIATETFREVKLFTGTFEKSLDIHIPNTKSFFVLFSASGSKIPVKLSLNYKRYGVSYEKTGSTTESPVKKQTIYEVQLEGRNPNDYHDLNFLGEVKKAIRASARSFCQIKGIHFNDSKTLDEMVFIRRISFCPFEWPNREICASIEHSVFVSGLESSGIILNYELTSEHLKEMWLKWDHPEMGKLGITVFRLPETYRTILWWTLFMGVVITASLVGVFVFWKIEKHSKETRKSNTDSVMSNLKRSRKVKLKPSKHQEIPSFMFASNELENETIKFRDPTLKSVNSESLLNTKPENEKSDERPQPPMKSYFGSILFGSNRAFEDDE